MQAYYHQHHYNNGIGHARNHYVPVTTRTTVYIIDLASKWLNIGNLNLVAMLPQVLLEMYKLSISSLLFLSRHTCVNDMII